MAHYPASNTTEVLELTAASQRQRQQHESVLLELEAKKVASTVDVPTLPDAVRAALRQLGLPVRLFGENLANVRERLRMELAKRQVTADQFLIKREENEEIERAAAKKKEEEVTKYTRASQALLEARQAIAIFSLERSRTRLEKERRLRAQAIEQKKSCEENQQAVDTELAEMDRQCVKTYKALRQMALEGSQYGDSRALSCISAEQVAGIPLVATGSWTGSLHLWDGSSPVLEQVGQQTMCHEDRIMGMDMVSLEQEQEGSALIATTSIDMTAKLWKVSKADVVMATSDDESEKLNETVPASLFTIGEVAHLKGHAARLCRTSFHPMKKHVATTSFDHSWRFWDIETGQDLLLQDGHLKECYGIGFHPDGSLASTTDYAGVIQVWDLRTGKSIQHFTGHAKRVLNAVFHSNGFQLATAGDDGTIKIWDLRRRQLTASLPAHSNLVTSLRFDSTGEFLASSSFDGTAKLWSCRDWRMLKQLQGHEGKVSGVEIVSCHSIVTCGFDKTLKLWR